jgi:hypothetical protein
MPTDRPASARHIPSQFAIRPGWPAAAALAAVVALLMTFGAVVQSGVNEGALRGQAQAIQSDSMQRCRSLHGKEVMAACLSRSNALAYGATTASK